MNLTRSILLRAILCCTATPNQGSAKSCHGVQVSVNHDAGVLPCDQHTRPDTRDQRRGKWKAWWKAASYMPLLAVLRHCIRDGFVKCALSLVVDIPRNNHLLSLVLTDKSTRKVVRSLRSAHGMPCVPREEDSWPVHLYADANRF